MVNASCLTDTGRLFFFQAEDGIRDIGVTGVQTLCSSDLAVGAAPGRDRHPLRCPGSSSGRSQVPFLFARLARLLRVRLPGWRLPLAVAVFVFLSSWAVMALVEPAETGIAAPGTYWWYFVVTAATVGYGDVFPASTAGRVVGAYVIVGGLVTQIGRASCRERV